jgi:O-antigen/teichoic acid export membrane protein
LLGASLLIQVVGAVTTILATILVTRLYGPVGQGYLGYFRSAVDLVVGIGTFGFPQAFVYMLNMKIAPVEWALRFSTVYSVLFALVTGVLGAALYITGIAASKGLDGVAVSCAVLASAALLAHGLYRAICLVTRSTVTFNVISILPSIVLLAIYLLARTAKYQLLVMAHAGAAMVSLFVVLGLFTWRNLFRQVMVGGGQQTLQFAVKYGFLSFLPHVSLAGATFLTYALLLQAPGAEAAVGYFSVSVLILSAAVMPLTMVIPVLFNAWSQPGIEDRRRASFVNLAHVGTLTCIAAILVGISVLGPATGLIFGSRFLPSVQVTKLLLLSAFALYQTRLSSALLLALGRADAVAVGSIIRLSAILAVMLSSDRSIASAAVAWVVAEYAGAGYLLATILRITQWPVLQTLGLSPENLLHTLRRVREPS